MKHPAGDALHAPNVSKPIATGTCIVCGASVFALRDEVLFRCARCAIRIAEALDLIVTDLLAHRDSPYRELIKKMPQRKRILEKDVEVTLRGVFTFGYLAGMIQLAGAKPVPLDQIAEVTNISLGRGFEAGVDPAASLNQSWELFLRDLETQSEALPDMMIFGSRPQGAAPVQENPNDGKA